MPPYVEYWMVLASGSSGAKKGTNRVAGLETVGAVSCTSYGMGRLSTHPPQVWWILLSRVKRLTAVEEKTSEPYALGMAPLIQAEV